MTKTTITVSIFDEERGDTTVSRDIELAPPGEDVGSRHDRVVRLGLIARESAAVAVSLHLI